MKLHYDPNVDALYLRLGDAKIVESEEVRPGIVLDFDSRDRVVAVEILNVRKQFPEANPDDLRLEVA
jgi:uncharacterized protein YuzE